MSNIDEGIKLADPDLYEHLKNCLDLHEIRGSESEVVKDWFGKALVTESLLNLVREKRIDVVGVAEVNGDFEPTFLINAEYAKTLLELFKNEQE
jgi:hypothetical protein